MAGALKVTRQGLELPHGSDQQPAAVGQEQLLTSDGFVAIKIEANLCQTALQVESP